MKEVNILIADSHKIVRDGIKAILESNPELRIAAEAGNVREILELCLRNRIDIVIIDPKNMNWSGIKIINKLQEQLSATKILVLTELEDEDYIQEMINCDVAGYLLKNSGKRDLFEAIEVIYEGEKYYSNEVTQLIIRDYMKSGESRKHTGDPGSLTRRECEVLGYICKEHTNQEIAEKLSISVRTVDSHRRNLLQKTGARNTAGLVRFAMEHKLFRA